MTPDAKAAALVGRLLAEQFPDLAALPLRPLAAGRDNAMFTSAATSPCGCPSGRNGLVKAPREFALRRTPEAEMQLDSVATGGHRPWGMVHDLWLVARTASIHVRRIIRRAAGAVR